MAGPAPRGGRADRQLSGRRSYVAFQAFQHLYKTGLLWDKRGGKGGHAGLLPPPGQPMGTSPLGSHWDWRHLLGRGGMPCRLGG